MFNFQVLDLIVFLMKTNGRLKKISCYYRLITDLWRAIDEKPTAKWAFAYLGFYK